MKIAHLIDVLSWGGAQKLLRTFAETARGRNIELTIISLRPPRIPAPYPELFNSMGVDVVVFPFGKLHDPRAIPFLVALLKKKHIEIVHTHLSHSNILGSLAGKITGIPVVSTIHNTQTDVSKRPRLPYIERFCLRNFSTRAIAVGKNVADIYRTIIKTDRLDVIPNAVEAGYPISIQERNEIRTALTGSPGKTLLIAVGRLTEQKGYAEMLTAFAKVHEKHPDTFLIIVGVGPLAESLKGYSQNLGLSDNVRFLGARTDVPKLLAACDVFLNSSYWEGLSIAMLEAMAAGLPVIATSVGDAEHLLATGGGLLVNVKDPSNLAVAINCLIENPDKMCTMGQLARSFVEKNYAAEPWLDKILQSYARAKQGNTRLAGEYQ
jgi:glycosyltransferase involved in cell wall biosynthesis